MTENKPKYWGKLIAEQEAGKQRIGQFCRDRAISEPSFYYWRNRLRKSAAVRFAVLETRSAPCGPTSYPIELILRNGERLRIGDTVDPATLRVVLETVRG